MSLKTDEKDRTESGRSLRTKSAAGVKALVVHKTDSVFTQFFRYAVVGAIATVADTGTLDFLNNTHRCSLAMATAAGFIVGLAICYPLTIKWVFASKRVGSAHVEFTAFALIGLIGLGLTELIVHLGSTLIHTGHPRLDVLVSKGIAVVTVTLWNFGARRTLLVRGGKSC